MPTSVREMLIDQLPKGSGDAAVLRGRQIVKEGLISRPNFPEVKLTERLWESAVSRAHGRYLHGFMFFADLAAYVEANPDRHDSVRQIMINTVLAWERNYAYSNQAGMAHHDETTAQRLFHVMMLSETLGLKPESGAPHAERVMAIAAEELIAAEFHATGTNHGMLQDLALLSYAHLIVHSGDEAKERYEWTALSRLKDYFESSFTTEGVHKEHSPVYHLMVCKYAKYLRDVLREIDHGDAEFYESIIARGSEYATHMLMPSGQYPPISDTAPTLWRKSALGHLFDSPEFRYAVTQGQEGRAPAKRIRVFEESGYAVFRDRWGSERGSFLIFSAAYNADYHKHSDDLSLYLRRDGIEVIREAGPFGFDYADPFTKYAFSSFAHNTLIVDNESLPRVDGQYGAVYLERFTPDSKAFRVEGVNTRFADVEHRRTIVAPNGSGDSFRVIDKVTSRIEHCYSVLWHFGSEVATVIRGKQIDVYSQGAKIMEMHIKTEHAVDIVTYHGGTEPRVQGWMFPDFGMKRPCDVIGLNFKASNVEVETQMVFQET